MEGEEQVVAPVEDNPPAAEGGDEPVEQQPDAQAAAPPDNPPVELDDEEAGDEVDLMSDNVPDWVKQFDARDKAFSIKQSDLDNMPMEARQAVHNFRRAFLQKTQKVAETQRGLEQELAVLKAEKRAINTERQQFYDTLLKNPQVAELMKPPEGEPPDPYTQEGQEWRAKAMFAGLMQQFLGAIEGKANEHLESHRQEVAQAAREQRLAELRAFNDKHPDFFSLKDEIKAVREAIPGISAEDAYLLVKAKNPGEPKAPRTRPERRRSQKATVRPSTRSGGKGKDMEAKVASLNGLSPRKRLEVINGDPDLKAYIDRQVRR